MIEVIRHPRDKAESKYNVDVKLTKEDEERYEKLLAENDELVKLIRAVFKLIQLFFSVFCHEYSFLFKFQKQEKIRLLKQRLLEKEAQGNLGGGEPNADDPALTGLLTKDTLIVPDFITGEGTSDSAYRTRSSRASASDFEFSESYL